MLKVSIESEISNRIIRPKTYTMPSVIVYGGFPLRKEIMTAASIITNILPRTKVESLLLSFFICGASKSSLKYKAILFCRLNQLFRSSFRRYWQIFYMCHQLQAPGFFASEKFLIHYRSQESSAMPWGVHCQ